LIRLALLSAVAAATACSGGSAPVPSGFGGECAAGPRIRGESQMGVVNDRPYTDVDATITMSGRTGGGACFGAARDLDDR
jgi:hypothetical protein